MTNSPHHATVACIALLYACLLTGAAAGEAPDYLVLSAMDDPAEWDGPFAPQLVPEPDGRMAN